jgi:2-polyprenyl-3-methyl-5-hydroxy-6-metoxy-1,4-benzoquinol methylase/RimJ/RimL family protein N-acetyltransferase
MNGHAFCLRPVQVDDAAFILELRSDPERNRYLHRISTGVNAQRRWIETYFERLRDYYFVIENRLTGRREGTIGIVSNEWGRWIVRAGSLAALESACLIYRVGFEVLGLAAILCRTVAENTAAVEFHRSFGLEKVRTLPGYFERDGRLLDAVEMRLTRPQWESIRDGVEGKAARLAAPETRRLDQIAEDSWYSKGLNASTVAYCGRVFSRFWRGARCLEMGPAEGLMTAQLDRTFPELTLLEGAERFCRALRDRFPNAKVVHSLFENFAPAGSFDTIVLGHVLEHVEDPVEVLRKARAWLAPGGVICCAVPNARSIHRQAAVGMRLLETEKSLNATDLHHGHRRVYDPETLQSDFRAAGLKLEAAGGYWLKPLSNDQIEKTWTPEMVEAFMQLGERYPDIAGEIYAIASA